MGTSQRDTEASLKGHLLAISGTICASKSTVITIDNNPWNKIGNLESILI